MKKERPGIAGLFFVTPYIYNNSDLFLHLFISDEGQYELASRRG